ncbi:MAG TPA: 2-dehydropantoate 2-reductase [Chryseosolibacter sp.]
MEKIFILGAGAIGKALAVFLTMEKREVVLLRASTDNIASATETINVERADGQRLTSEVAIHSLRQYKRLDGLVVITSKAFGNTELAERLKEKTGDSPLVILQNGLHVEQPFLNYFPGVYRCVLFATSQLINSDQIRFKPVSSSPIGIVKGSPEELAQTVRLLDSENFHFHISDKIQETVWKKVIANCVFNSICPLLDIDNGIFHRNSEALNLAREIVNECTTIAKAGGVVLDTEEILATITLISRSSDGQLISTLQDIRSGRETEIESLNLAIVKLAAELNLENAVPLTKMLGHLIKLKSGRFQI